MTWVLEARSLRKRFGELVAVDDMSLTLRRGEIFGLLGPNGAGKSTAIKMLTTLLKPDAGSALVGGYCLQRQSALVRQVIGSVPQLLSADGMLTGYENLLIFAKLYNLPRAQRRPRIAEALEQVGLLEAAQRRVSTYSGGMIRRLELALAMLHRPHILFLDEPTVGLDPLARQAIWKQVRHLVHERQGTVLLTTHFMEEAEALCDRLAIMHLGQVVATGTPQELKESLGTAGSTLDEVFVHYTGNRLETEGTYRDISRTRRTAARLG